MAADFDRDGDLDIAAISFFPDTNRKPQESFIYLEQKSGFNFEPFVIRQYNEGNWLTMDIGDSFIVFSAVDIKASGDKQIVKIPSGAKKITRQEFQKMMDEAFGPSNGNGGPQIRIITRDGGGQRN